MEGKGGIVLRMIAIGRLRRRLAALFAAVCILLALCWGVPRFYGFLTAENEEEFQELDDPVRVENVPDPETTADWLNFFSR